MKRGGPLRRRTPLRVVGRKQRQSEQRMRQVREQVEARAQGRCEARFSERCTGRGVHAHHVVRKSQGGADTASNCLWVCSECHARCHAFPELAREAGLLKSRGDLWREWRDLGDPGA